MTIEEARDFLRKECEAVGSQVAWANAHGLSAAYVSDAIRGRRAFGRTLLRELGLESVVVYRRANGGDDAG